MKMKAYIEERAQHARGGRGPDRYVAVQVVPDGVERLKQLRESVAERRGIRIIHCGEGYYGSRGPRSALGQALAKAAQICAEINGESTS
jgi:hypothetical protein